MLEDERKHFSNPGAERALLTIALKESDCVLDIDTVLNEEDFSVHENREIFKSIKRLYFNSDIKSIDINALMHDLSLHNAMNVKENAKYLKTLFEFPVDAPNINFYLRKVKEASLKYKFFVTAENLKEQAWNNATDGDDYLNSNDLIALGEDNILKISMDTLKSEEPIDLGAGLKDILDKRVENPVKIKGLPTGFDILDERIDGLKNKNLIVIGGRMKSGKSTFLMTVAVNAAYRNQHCPVLYVDSEMDEDEQRDRSLTMLSKVPERYISHGTYKNKEHWIKRVDQAAEIMEHGKNRIYFKELPAFKAEEVGALARKYKKKHDIGLLILDYIKIPYGATDKSLKEWQLLGYLATYLKDLASELNIPILSAAQLNREADEKSQIRTSYFGGSDRILQYANTGLALAPKTDKEFKEYGGIDAGTHWLHVVVARGGGACRNIGIKFTKYNLEMVEAVRQSVQFEKGDYFEEAADSLTTDFTPPLPDDLGDDLDDNAFEI